MTAGAPPEPAPAPGAARGEPPLPGRALVHPRALLAAGALVFNVFWLRRRHPGAVSGKLSDVALCFLLPVLLAAVVEWSLALGRWLGARRLPAALGPRGVVAVCAACALYFLLLKAWPGFTPVHRALLGGVARALGIGWRFRNIADPTDLVALAMVPVAAWHLRECAERGRVTLRSAGSLVACSRRAASRQPASRQPATCFRWR